MSSSIRKKRNFKGLHLADTPLASPTPKTAATTTGGGGASTSSSSTSYNKLTGTTTSTTGSANTDVPSTARSTTLIAPPALPGADPSSGANYHNKLSEQLANLEMGVEYKLDLKNEDLTFRSELGSGNGGTVTKVSIWITTCNHRFKSDKDIFSLSPSPPLCSSCTILPSVPLSLGTS